MASRTLKFCLMAFWGFVQFRSGRARSMIMPTAVRTKDAAIDKATAARATARFRWKTNRTTRADAAIPSRAMA